VTVAFAAPHGDPDILPDDLLTVIDVSDVVLKALLPIVVTLLGIVIDVNAEHPLKALLPIDVTLDGIVTLVKFVQLIKA
jgi:hypothetical protein